MELIRTRSKYNFEFYLKYASASICLVHGFRHIPTMHSSSTHDWFGIRGRSPPPPLRLLTDKTVADAVTHHRFTIQGCSSFFIAVEYEQLHVVQWMLTHGDIDVNTARDSDGATPIFLASANQARSTASKIDQPVSENTNLSSQCKSG
jgi:hypothetical protein